MVGEVQLDVGEQDEPAGEPDLANAERGARAGACAFSTAASALAEYVAGLASMNGRRSDLRNGGTASRPCQALAAC